MPADASGSQANAATITFDVIVDPSVVEGTIISNQGFVTAIESALRIRTGERDDDAI